MHKNLFAIFQPRWVLRIYEKYSSFLLSLTIVLFIIGLIDSLILSPPDYQQQETVRILYIHVPSAWLGMALYCLMALFSLIGLLWHIPLSHFIAHALAPIGGCFTLNSLITGSIWGIPTWGTWWIWDARLTSMLVLFFLYLGYSALFNSFQNAQQAYRTSSVLVILGTLNIPIIKWSVEWWHTLHQPSSIMRLAKPALAPAMLRPLFLMTLGFLGFTLWMTLSRVASLIYNEKQNT
jgi:heme exporter protein C